MFVRRGKATLAVASAGAVAVTALAFGSVAIAQSGSGEDIAISPGFLPDPQEVSYVSGGNTDASDVYDSHGVQGGPCRGYINHPTPDHYMILQDDFDYLKVWLETEEPLQHDTTLIIDGPGDVLLCDDDSGQGLNEMIDAQGWPSGRYEIYVGTYGSDSEHHRYELSVTELENRGPQ